jgi:hypothetical protein
VPHNVARDAKAVLIPRNQFAICQDGLVRVILQILDRRPER